MSVSLLGLSSAFSSDLSNGEISDEKNTLSQNVGSSRLSSMPAEVLGQIANYLDARDVIKLQTMTGDRVLAKKTSEESFYQNYSNFMHFSAIKKKEAESLKRFLQRIPSSITCINISILDDTTSIPNSTLLETLKEILPFCKSVKSLDLNSEMIADGKRSIALAEYMPNLTSLKLIRESIWSAFCFRSIVNSINIPTLTSLDLSKNWIKSAGAQALANSPHFSSLTSLDLSSNEIRDDGAQALAKSLHFSRLTHLNLNHNEIGDDGAQALANSLHFSRLTHLNLNRNRIGTEGAQALANSPHSSRLIYLDLSSNGIKAAGVQALATNFNFPSLTHLNLGENDLGAEGVRVLADSPHFPNLIRLDLSGNRIGTEGVIALANSSHFPSLAYLDISFNWIDSTGVRDIIANLNCLSHIYSKLMKLMHKKLLINVSPQSHSEARAMYLGDLSGVAPIKSDRC